MGESKSMAEMLKEELDVRIKEIESPDYEYVPKLNKGDYIGMALTAAACIFLIIVGIF